MALALPADLELSPPPLTAAELVAAKRDLLAEIRANEADRARLYARTMRTRARVGALWGKDRPGSGLMDLAGTARIGQDRAHGQTVAGLRLVQLFPQALRLLEQGQMWQGTAEMLLSMSKNLTAEQQLQLDERVSREVVTLDARDARAVIARTIAELLSADEARAKHEQAKAQRGVWVKTVEDGMARVGAEVDQVSAKRWALDFEEIVRAQRLQDKKTGRKRTTQQRRADVFTELPSRLLHLTQAIQRGEAEQLLEGALAANDDPASDSAPVSLAERPTEEILAAWLSLPVRNPIVMYVHTPMSTVLDLDNRSGVVEGLGALPAHQVRLLRPVASLARLAVDQASGLPLGIDPDIHPPPDPSLDPEETARLVRSRLLHMLRPIVVRDEAEPRHDPSPRLRRLVEIRDQGCDGPGCSAPARRCELDHDIPYAQGGQTGVWNLVARSPRCHHGKHDGWTVIRHSDGSSTWTSPTGQTYRRRSRWRPPSRPADNPYEDPPALPAPEPDQLDDTDPREDWNLDLWRGPKDPPAF